MSGSPPPTRDEVYARLIRMLVEARLEAGLRQADLARQLGQRQNYVSRYETLDRRIDMGQFVEAALAIGVDPVAMFARALAEASSL